MKQQLIESIQTKLRALDKCPVRNNYVHRLMQRYYIICDTLKDMNESNITDYITNKATETKQAHIVDIKEGNNDVDIKVEFDAFSFVQTVMQTKSSKKN